MSLHKSHGKARPSTARADELPTGVAADVAGPVERAPDGRIAGSEAARELGRRGGKAKAEKKVNRWGARLGLGSLLADPLLGAEARFRPFLEDGEAWYRAKCAELAATVGGGICSAGVTSIVRTATMERAFSAYLFEMATTKAFAWARGTKSEGKTGEKFDVRLDLVAMASKLGDSSRQNLLAAHELCAREAMARKNAPTTATSDMQSKLEKVLIAEAENYRDATKRVLEQRSASTVEESVQSPSASPEPLRSGPPRNASSVAPGASAAAPHPTSAPSTHLANPSAPGGNVAPSTPRHPTPEEADEAKLRKLCSTWVANSGRKTIEQSQACLDAQFEAMGIIEGRYSVGQDMERTWRSKGSRGRMPVPAIVVPWPASKWWREHRDGAEAHYSEHVFGWRLEPDPKEQR